VTSIFYRRTCAWFLTICSIGVESSHPDHKQTLRNSNQFVKVSDDEIKQNHLLGVTIFLSIGLLAG
jgi:hypothetical protein